jgi:Domain of Unknown Function (DUF1080)
VQFPAKSIFLNARQNMNKAVFQLAFLCLFPLIGDTARGQQNDEPGPDNEWIELFDGKSLDGWVKRGGAATYSIEDNAIVGTTAPDTPNTFLCTAGEYGDFELELEFQVHTELNSGVQIRSLSLPDYQNGRVHGYQVEIDPSERAFTGGIYDEARRGWLFDLKTNEEARKALRQGEWNRMRVLAKGSSIKTWINDVPAADLTDEMTSKGFIALQVHGVGSRKDPITVRWRNIRLRELKD